MERKQMKDFMNMYTNLVQRCFNDCVSDFSSKTLLGKEEHMGFDERFGSVGVLNDRNRAVNDESAEVVIESCS